MKNRIFKKDFIVFATVAILFCTSCSKDEDNNNPSLQEITQTDIKTVLEADEIAEFADTILTDAYSNLSGEKSFAKKSIDCYEGTFNETGFSLTFDNCSADSGESLNGTINVVYVSEGETLSYTATFVDFTVGGIRISGTRSFNFNGYVEGSTYSFTVTSDLTITLDDTTIVRTIGTKTFDFILGDSLETSIYKISGNWTVEIGSDTYSVVVNDMLEGNLACEYITAGNMTLSKNGLAVDVDFGDGACDNQATVIYPDGTNEEISLDD